MDGWLDEIKWMNEAKPKKFGMLKRKLTRMNNQE